MYRIAFFNINAYGHTNPTLAVVRELTALGHQVRYYSFSPFRSGIEAAGASFVSCDQYLPPPPPDLDRRIGKDFASLVEMVTDTTLSMEQDIGADLVSFRPHCIVSDSICFWGKLWARRLGTPYVCSTTTFAFNRRTAALMRQTPGQMLGMLAGRGRIRRCMARLRAHGWAVEGLLSLIQNDNDTDTIVYTSRQFQPMAEVFSARYAFIGPSLSEITREQDRPGPRALYISLGTVNNRNLPFYQACVEAFREPGLEVTIAVGEATDPSALGPLPPHITVRQRVEQLAVLARSHVFLAHGGMNSVSESLYLGVPLVLFPQQAEQALVARRTAELGAGLLLKHASPDAIRSAVLQVLGQPEYKARAGALSADLRSAGGARRGAEKILSVVEDAP